MQVDLSSSFCTVMLSPQYRTVAVGYYYQNSMHMGSKISSKMMNFLMLECRKRIMNYLVEINFNNKLTSSVDNKQFRNPQFQR